MMASKKRVLNKCGLKSHAAGEQNAPRCMRASEWLNKVLCLRAFPPPFTTHAWINPSTVLNPSKGPRKRVLPGTEGGGGIEPSILAQETNRRSNRRRRTEHKRQGVSKVKKGLFHSLCVKVKAKRHPVPVQGISHLFLCVCLWNTLYKLIQPPT